MSSEAKTSTASSTVDIDLEYDETDFNEETDLNDASSDAEEDNNDDYDDEGSLNDETINEETDDVKMRPRSKSLAASKQSIEVFLNKFPADETEYTNYDLKNTVTEIMHSDIGLDTEANLIAKIRLIMRSNKFQLIMTLLVVLDCIFILFGAVIDILDYKWLSSMRGKFDDLSLAVLCIFVIEIFFKFLFITRVFLRSKLVLFDTIIVFVSFTLEILTFFYTQHTKSIDAAVIAFR